MKKQDFYFSLFILLLFLPFVIFPELFKFYESFNKSHGIFMAFIKFAILATLGESIGLRIQKGVYNTPTFGLINRMFVWGLLGITIKFAFVIFYSGVPILLQYIGIKDAISALKSSTISSNKLIVAFSISLLINTIYAPIMMTLHKITDTHILQNRGKLSAIIKPINFSVILKNLDWDTQWNFIFKKTIPFFWIPAHTITFMLKPEYQVLFAAFLGIALGLILAFANLKKEN